MVNVVDPLAAELSSGPGQTLTRTLDNGLRVQVMIEHNSRVAGAAVHYGVGFRSEAPGRSGFAHLFEHLMFQGGASTSADHFRCVEASGGFCNASTRQDYTDFYNIVPVEGLEYVLAAEADRMRAPKMTHRAIRTQTDVVREEILTKTQRPYGRFPWPLLSPVLFRTFANTHDGYGDYAALRDVTVEECLDFFGRHYSPANAVVTVAADLEPARALSLVDRTFGTIVPRPVPTAPSWHEPYPLDQREETYRDPRAPLPAVAVGYRVPDPVLDPRGHLALWALADVLTGGANPRLGGTLAGRMRQPVTVSARAGLFDCLDARDPDLWIFTAVHRPDLPVGAIVERLDGELAALAETGPTDRELRAVRARRINAHHRNVDQLTNRIRSAGRFGLLFGDPDLLRALPGHLAALTAEDLAHAARGLRPEARAVLTVTPGRA